MSVSGAASGRERARGTAQLRAGRSARLAAVLLLVKPGSYFARPTGVPSPRVPGREQAVVRDAHRWARERDAVILDEPQEFPRSGEHCFATYWLDPHGFKLEAVTHARGELARCVRSSTTGTGPPEVLHVEDVEPPVPGGGQFSSACMRRRSTERTVIAAALTDSSGGSCSASAARGNECWGWSSPAWSRRSAPPWRTSRSETRCSDQGSGAHAEPSASPRRSSWRRSRRT